MLSVSVDLSTTDSLSMRQQRLKGAISWLKIRECSGRDVPIFMLF